MNKIWACCLVVWPDLFGFKDSNNQVIPNSKQLEEWGFGRSECQHLALQYIKIMETVKSGGLEKLSASEKHRVNYATRLFVSSIKNDRKRMICRLVLS